MSDTTEPGGLYQGYQKSRRRWKNRAVRNRSVMMAVETGEPQFIYAPGPTYYRVDPDGTIAKIDKEDLPDGE